MIQTQENVQETQGDVHMAEAAEGCNIEQS